MTKKCDKNQILANIRRVSGQVEGVERMVEEDRDIAEVLQQLLAAESALRSVGRMLLLDYAHGCFNAQKKLDKKDLEKLIVQLFKNA